VFGECILGLTALERHPGNVLLLGEGTGTGDILLGDLPEQGRRGDGMTPVLGEERDEAADGLQAGDVAMEVEPVEAFELEGDMPVQQRLNSDGSVHMAGDYKLVGLRSKTSPQ
jgi:hypothetical protein